MTGADSIPATIVVANARLELLRTLAAVRDHHEKDVRDGYLGADDPTLVPLGLGRGHSQNAWEDIVLAARECAALGEIQLVPPQDAVDRMMEPVGFVAITDVGYARIRAHDALGETAQDGAA